MTQQVLARGGDWTAEGMNYEEFYRSGYRFAIRYVVPSIPGKMVSALEVATAHAAHIDMGFVYETDGTTWQGGKDAGITDGKAANDAMQSIKAPSGVTVYHAVDSQVLDSELPTVIQWVTGLQEGMPDYSIGIYGQYSVMSYVANHFPHLRLWQTPAWSNGGVYPALEMYQDSQVKIGAITLDTDSLLADEASAGFWTWSAPTPPPKGGHVDEIITQADWRYCSKCKCLNYAPEEAESKCAGGGTHDNSSSGNYVLTDVTGSTTVS